MFTGEFGEEREHAALEDADCFVNPVAVVKAHRECRLGERTPWNRCDVLPITEGLLIGCAQANAVPKAGHTPSQRVVGQRIYAAMSGCEQVAKESSKLRISHCFCAKSAA